MGPVPPEAFASYEVGEEWCMNKIFKDIEGKHPSEASLHLHGLLNFLNGVRSLPGENPPYLDRMIETIEKLCTVFGTKKA